MENARARPRTKDLSGMPISRRTRCRSSDGAFAGSTITHARSIVRPLSDARNPFGAGNERTVVVFLRRLNFVVENSRTTSGRVPSSTSIVLNARATETMQVPLVFEVRGHASPGIFHVKVPPRPSAAGDFEFARPRNRPTARG